MGFIEFWLFCAVFTIGLSVGLSYAFNDWKRWWLIPLQLVVWPVVIIYLGWIAWDDRHLRG